MCTEPRIQRVVWSRQGIGLAASVLQRNDLRVHTFVTDHPSLILLRRGRKTVQANGKKIVLSPGDAVAIAAGSICDVQNATERGQFESTWIVCADPILSKLERAYPNHPKLATIAALQGLGGEFVQSFERTVRAIVSPGHVPDVVAEHRCRSPTVRLQASPAKSAMNRPHASRFDSRSVLASRQWLSGGFHRSGRRRHDGCRGRAAAALGRSVPGRALNITFSHVFTFLYSLWKNRPAFRVLYQPLFRSEAR